MLQGGDLSDHTETVKAIALMAILAEIGADVTDLGKSMLDSRFTRYAIQGDKPEADQQLI